GRFLKTDTSSVRARAHSQPEMQGSRSYRPQTVAALFGSTRTPLNIRAARLARSTRLNACLAFAYLLSVDAVDTATDFGRHRSTALRPWRRCWSRSWRRFSSYCSRELELTDARLPARVVILVGMPERQAVGRINRGHAVIAPPCSELGA